MKINIELIAEANYYAGIADASQNSDEDLLGGKVYIASNNFAAIKKTRTEEKRKIIEKILNNAGFEHLVAIRAITRNQTFGDFVLHA